MPKRLLIDISGLIYRSAYALKLTHRGKPTGAVYGTLKALGHLADLYEPEEMVICWDAGHAHQTKLYPEYKADRKKDPDFVADLDHQKGVLRSLLKHLPLVQVTQAGVEADDIIGVLAGFLRLEDVGIVTGDTDLYCLSSPKCMLITNDGVAATLELPANQYVDFKVLVGGEDNIKGVEGIGKVRAKRLLQDCGSLDSFMAEVGQTGSAAGVRMDSRQYGEAVNVIARNRKLMTPGALLAQGERVAIIDQYRYGRLRRRLDRGGFREALMEQGIVSIVSRLQGYLMPFKAMERGDEAKAKAETSSQGRAESRSVRSDRREGDRTTRVVRRVESCVPKVRKVDGGEGARGAGGVQGAAAGAPKGGAQARAAEVLARLRAQAAMGLAAPSGRSRSEGAVRDGAGQARARRAGLAAAGVLHDEEVLPEQCAGSRALSVLQMLRSPGGQAWIKTRPSRDLRRVLNLIENVLLKGKQVPLDEEEFLFGLEEAFGSEMPSWMLTEKEIADNAKNVIKNNMHRRPQPPRP